MRHWSRRGLAVTALVIVCVALACTKKQEETAAEQKKEREKPDRPATSSASAVTPENAPFAPVIAGRGFQIVQAKRFPAQVDGRRASIVVYRATGGARGGILYVRGQGNEEPRPVWHWYFQDGAPDSARAVELNNDGLWDVRVFMAGGTTRDFLQEKDFSFAGAERAGLTAMNGGSSSPDGLWKAFDADTSTAWVAPSQGAFIDLPNPLGLATGQLSVRLSGKARPGKIEVADGEKKLQECDLDATVEEQRFLLDPAVKDLATIRLYVVGAGKNVAISELEIQ